MNIKERVRKWFDTPRRRKRKRLNELVNKEMTDGEKLQRRWDGEPIICSIHFFVFVFGIVMMCLIVFLGLRNSYLLDYHIENIHGDNYELALEETMDDLDVFIDEIPKAMIVLFVAVVGIDVFIYWRYTKKTRKMEEELLAKHANEAVK